MTNYTAVVSGVDGIRKSDEIVLMQASTITPVVFDFIQADATPYTFEAGDIVSGTFVDDVTLEEFSISGTITPAAGGNTASWARSAADVGTPADYRLYMRVTREGVFDYTEPSPLTVLSVPGVGITPPSPLVGVSIAEAAWLAVALDTIPDASDLITSADVDNKQDKDTDATAANVAIFDANGQTVDAGFALGTAAQSDDGDFDAAGSAATAQAFAIQRANHTGTQTSSTISDFAATVRATVLTGLSTATNAVITAADTVLEGLGKLQAQITGHVSATGTAVHGLGTMATEAATDYYLQSSFSSSPAVASLPLETNVNGFIELVKLITATIQSTASLNIISAGNILFSGGNVLFTRDNVGGTQFVVRGETNTNIQLVFGVSTSTGNGKIQAITQGVNEKPLDISSTRVNFQSFSVTNAYVDSVAGQYVGKTIVLNSMKSGATQAAAGAAAGELWKTAGHATLEDNVVLHGV